MQEENGLSKLVKCKHDLVVLLPETEIEHIDLAEQISKLFSHLKSFPNCKFRQVGYDE